MLVEFVLLSLDLSSGEEFGEVTVVTAFFDIDRENFKKLPRSVNTYINYFKRWARLKNEMVIFCENHFFKEEVINIRKGFFLENKTVVEVIENLYSVEEDMYDKLLVVSKDPHFLNFRLKKDIAENNAKYNFVQIFKTYFMYAALKSGFIKTDCVTWIDFGFDKGGRLYPHEDDWSFRLDCELSDKVAIFRLPHKLDSRPLFEIVRTVHPDTLTGGFFICPTKMIKKLWALMKECVYNLLSVGLMDDDQPIFLLAVRREPKYFKIKRSCWYYGLKQSCKTVGLRINEKYLERRGLVEKNK